MKSKDFTHDVSSRSVLKKFKYSVVAGSEHTRINKYPLRMPILRKSPNCNCGIQSQFACYAIEIYGKCKLSSNAVERRSRKNRASKSSAGSLERLSKS